ncbi:MAG: hypothetical protein CMB62_00395 [Euryarchaeota archaeon]|nr:hypothetical protein [Euryarchaeota archaeon]
MLRSTSVKQESWKPVKLLAKQPVKGKILALECDLEGKIAVALTSDSINIFNERELLNVININQGFQLKISSSLENIYVLTSEKLCCFDYWGNQKWEYVSEGLIDDFVVDNSGKHVVLRGEKFLIFLNRFGDLEWEHNFSEVTISMHYSNKGDFLVSTSNRIFILTEDNDFDKIVDISNQLQTFFSDEGGIAVTDKNLISFSLTGHILWQKTLSDVKYVTYSNNSLKNYFVNNDKSLICQDRNGDELWTYSSEDELEGFNVLDSGRMVGQYSNTYFHIIDEYGDQAWSYYAREKIVDFSFSCFGADIIIASESKIHWFQNEGFLRKQVSTNIETISSLMSKVLIYESNISDIEDNFTLVKEQSGGNFTTLKKSFSMIVELKNRLEHLHKRHVNYLDSLPKFMNIMGLQGAQTDDMVPLIYPYFSLYGDIKDNSNYAKLLEFATHLLSKLDRYDLTKIKNDSIFDLKNFIKDAKKGINEEMDNIQKLINQSEKDLKKLKIDVNKLIIGWLESGNIDNSLQDFFYNFVDNIATRSLKKDIILEKMESHMAFVDYTTSNDSVKLKKFRFRTRKEVELKLELLNKSDNTLENLKIRTKIEGNGLELLSPPSGVVRINHLKPKESSPITFSFSPISRVNTRVILVVQYLDSVGRKCTNWLGDVETNFLGCFVRPLPISENEHENDRLEFKDNTSHTSLNIEGLQVSKITKIAKKMPGLHLCNLKEEGTRSIIYHAGESSLDDSKYLSMIFLRKLGEDESLRVALELICHSTDTDNSAELKEEMLFYLKNKLLELNAKFV